MERTTRGIRRVLVVGALALVGFAVAIVALGDDARRGCVVDAPRDPSYQAQILGRMEMASTEQEIALTREGTPVVGAKVCTRVSMVGMEAMGSSDSKAQETAPGVYRVAIIFEMTGGWEGNILVVEKDRPPISVPLRFDVF